ncbi:D-Ala-D-Ala carboxypeptidase family metallohydrolase [Lysobacter tyrosinilyticus]
MKPTLQLVADLRATGILKDVVVASAWRSPSFNRCEGGSSASRHLTNNALDFDIRGTLDVIGLCAYWRTHGAARKFGLGFYSPTEIHVDTSGFRTWGYDYHRATSLCTPARR